MMRGRPYGISTGVEAGYPIESRAWVIQPQKEPAGSALIDPIYLQGIVCAGRAKVRAPIFLPVIAVSARIAKYISVADSELDCQRVCVTVRRSRKKAQRTVITAAPKLIRVRFDIAEKNHAR
jgi:hypothetical protein